MSEHKRTFPSLSGTNYATWADNMEAYLCTKDLFTVTDGSESEPVSAGDRPTSAELREIREWKSRRAKASGEIWLAVEDEQKTHIKPLKGQPEKMWAKLKEVHLQKKPGARFNAYDGLFAIRKQENESLTTLMARAHSALQSIQELRPENFTLEMLDQELECMALIRALPEEYNNFVSSLLLLDSLDLGKLRSAFQNEENQRIARNNDPTSPFAALQARSPAKCYFCDSPDHLIGNCPKMKEASARAKGNTPARGKGKFGRRGGKHNANEANDKLEKEEKEESTKHAHVESAGHASALSSMSYSQWSKTRASTDWNTDTGASSHMTPHRHWFRSYSPHVVPVRLADNSIIKSAGIGSVEFQPVVNGSNMRPVTFHDVLHVPALGSNLLSLFHLTSHKGYSIAISGRTVSFYHSGSLLFTASVTDHNIGYLNGHAISFNMHEARQATTLPLDLSLWHRRCSHVNYDDLRRMHRNKLTNGLTMESNAAPDPICEPCIAGKQHRHNIPRTATRRNKPLALIHTDLKGPMPVATPEGFRYWITFIDDSKRFWTVYFLKKKSDAFTAFKAYKAYAEKALGMQIMMTRDDKGGEYMGKEYEKFCVDHGISRQHTEPNEPHQNGVAERANRDIADGATTLLVEAKLPPSFWGLAVMAYVHTRNRTPTSALGGEIPYTGWKDKKPDISYFRVFGCLAYVLIRKEKRKALQPHSRKCIFVGYAYGTKAWLFWDPANKKFITSSHAVFDERYLPGNSTKAIDLITCSTNEPKPSGPTVVTHHGGDNTDSGSDSDDDEPPPVPVPVANPEMAPPPQPPVLPPVQPPPQRRNLPQRSSRPTKSLNFNDLQRQNVPGPSHQIPPAAAPPPPAREESPDPLLMSPPRFTPDFHTPRKPATVIDSDTEEEEIDNEDDFEEEAHMIQAGLEFVQTDYLDWDDAVEYAFSTEEFALRVTALKTAAHDSEPRSFREAMQRPEPERGQWLKAALDEIQALVDNGTFDLVQLPAGKRAIGSRWVFRVKRKADGSIERHKGRLVAQGFSQRPGFDFNETFAPTPTWAALRAVLAIAAIEDLELESIDISSAFLNGELEEEVYM